MQNSQRHVTVKQDAGSSQVACATPSLSLLKGKPTRPATALSVFVKIVAPALLTGLLWTQIYVGAATALLLTCISLIGFQLVSSTRWGETSGIVSLNKIRFGERVWLNRLLLPIPVDANMRITVCYLVFWTGLLFALWGAWIGSLVVSLPGLGVAYAARIACFKALVQLYETMKNDVPLYRLWTSTPLNDNHKGSGT